MNILSYINREKFKDSIPGNREAYVSGIKFNKEISELKKFDKIINAIWSVDKNSDVCILSGLLHCSFIIVDRWFIVDQNPNNTFTLQRNIDEDIIYIVDGCKYQGTIAKKIQTL